MGYDVYVLILCGIVLVGLTAFSVSTITYAVRARIQLINNGLLDEQLLKERAKEEKRKKSFFGLLFDKILPSFFVAVILLIFVFSFVVGLQERGDFPSMKVVGSDSMSVKLDKNEYLFENKLDNQIQVFDLIFIDALPKESELNLYDVVVYEKNGDLFVHRIVGITEPDQTHSERYFLLQGDANRFPDSFPVVYSQMRGVYTGIRIPYVGSFVNFMNSPAGYICILLVGIVCVSYPIIEKKLKKIADARLSVIDGSGSAPKLIISKFDKNAVADYAQSVSRGKLTIKRSKDFTSSGLPVADVYYLSVDGKDRCAAFVSVTKDGLLSIKFAADESTKAECEKIGVPLSLSAFPRRSNNSWYTVKLKPEDVKSVAVIESIFNSFGKNEAQNV